VSALSWLDSAALGFFVLSWLGYHFLLEGTPRSLNVLMNEHRKQWMRQAIIRDNRVVDTTIMASLQNGTAFFASTSLIAVGGVLTVLRATDDVLAVMSQMPLGTATSRLLWEVKVLGLAVIFVYAFFKFAWAYRVVKGVVRPGTEEAAERAARMNIVAGRHFNRGQRAFFFALAYLGWFLGPLVFIGTTAAVLYVIWRRQFASDAITALG
jgi:uncharacterized membrane protein